MRLRTRLWLGGLAAGGVAVAHVLAFLVVAPDAVLRAELLADSGHGALPVMLSLAMGALVAGLAGFALRRAGDDHTPPRALFRSTLVRLAPLHVAGFLVLEAAERLARHDPSELPGFLTEPVVLIGLLLAAATAVVSAALLVLFAGLIDRLVRFLRALPRAPRVLAAPLAEDPLPRTTIALGSISLRGPPLPVG